MFWEIIIDDTQKTFEIIGKSSNDTLLTNNVCEMQQKNMKVRCQTLDISYSETDIQIKGYKLEENLYARLLSEYEQKTKKQLKRW